MFWACGVLGARGGGSPKGLVEKKGLVHVQLVQFFTLGSSKIKVFETCFFDLVIAVNDHPRYVKHVSGRIHVFFTLFAIGWEGGGQTGLVHILLMQFFTLYSSKIAVFETYFFGIVITQNDHPRYVKHVLARIYVVFTLSWVCVAWGRFSARWTCRRQ